jgi:hypothetical protein
MIPHLEKRKGLGLSRQLAVRLRLRHRITPLRSLSLFRSRQEFVSTSDPSIRITSECDLIKAQVAR